MSEPTVECAGGASALGGSYFSQRRDGDADRDAELVFGFVVPWRKWDGVDGGGVAGVARKRPGALDLADQCDVAKAA